MSRTPNIPQDDCNASTFVFVAERRSHQCINREPIWGGPCPRTAPRTATADRHPAQHRRAHRSMHWSGALLRSERDSSGATGLSSGFLDGLGEKGVLPQPS